VASGEDALERILQDPPTLVALDIGLAGALDGWQVLTSLKAHPETAQIPVIVCTAGNNRPQAATLGAADFLVKPFSRSRVRSAIARLLPAGGSVLVADDDENIRRLVRDAFADNGIKISEAPDGEETLKIVRSDHPPDVLILDLMMPKLDGFAVLEEIQGDEATRSIAVIVLSGKQLSEEERRFLRFRAFSVLDKSECSPAELRRLVAEALGLVSR
jgi:CheY-like chemotaxis protein